MWGGKHLPSLAIIINTEVSKTSVHTRHNVQVELTDRTNKGGIMPNYLCMQRSLPGGADSGEKPSPTQMQEMYAQFKDRGSR